MTPYYQDEYVTLYLDDCLENIEWLTADVMVTDPPYGMAYSSNRTKSKRIAGDRTTSLRDEVLVRWGNRPALMFGSWKVARPDKVRQLIVWDKRGGAGFSGDLNMPWADITEEIYVFGQGWVGGRRPAIYSIPTIPHMQRVEHPTPKPVRLMSELLQCCPDGVIADPFAGSGTTLLAARNMGRKAIGVEIDERYCEITAQRLGQQAFMFDDFMEQELDLEG
jgi:site-specific DNA-methyltransferase (adenine-specific)